MIEDDQAELSGIAFDILAHVSHSNVHDRKRTRISRLATISKSSSVYIVLRKLRETRVRANKVFYVRFHRLFSARRDFFANVTSRQSHIYMYVLSSAAYTVFPVESRASSRNALANTFKFSRSDTSRCFVRIDEPNECMYEARERATRRYADFRNDRVIMTNEALRKRAGRKRYDTPRRLRIPDECPVINFENLRTLNIHAIKIALEYPGATRNP